MKRTLLAVPVTLLLLGSLTACVNGGTPDTTKTSPAVTSSMDPTQAADALIKQTKQDAKDAKRSLEALPEQPNKYLSKDAKQQLGNSGLNPDDAFPKGSKVAANESSWHAVGDNEGLMDTTFTKPDGTTTTYVAAMIKKGGVWQLLYTVEPTK